MNLYPTFVRLFAVGLFTVSALAIVIPVVAESSVLPDVVEPIVDSNLESDDSSDFGFTWTQYTSTKDEFDFYGPSSLHSAEGTALAFAIMTAAGVDKNSKLQSVDNDFNDPPSQLVGYSDAHLLTVSNGWKAGFDTQAMAQAALNFGFLTMDIDLCTASGAQMQYSVDPDVEWGDCKSWTLDTPEVARGGGVLSIVENPKVSNYRHVVLFLGVGILVLTLLFSFLTDLLRRKRMPVLDGGNLLFSVVAVTLGAGCVVIVAGVFALRVGSVQDVLMVKEWGIREHVVLALGPALLSSLPFLLPAILIVTAKSRPLAQAGAVKAAGGVPYWMVAPAAESQCPQELSSLPPTQQLPSPPLLPPNPWDPPT